MNFVRLWLILNTAYLAGGILIVFFVIRLSLATARVEQQTRLITNLLTVWAANWGSDAAAMKAALLPFLEKANK